MNFNVEMENELNELNLGEKGIPIFDEAKETSQDYTDLEENLLLADMENTKMARESGRDLKLGLSCESSLVEQAVKMRQELTGSYYRLEELERIFIKTPLADKFEMDNISQCDTGSVQKGLRKELIK